MNTPPEPLLQSLADEATHLPLRAAIEARQRSAHRVQIRQRFALAGTIALLGLLAWALFPSRQVSPSLVAIHPATPKSTPDLAPPAPEPRDDVKVQIDEDAALEPLPLPTGLDREQQELVKAAGDLPLLLVRDSTGKVTRIHVIER